LSSTFPDDQFRLQHVFLPDFIQSNHSHQKFHAAPAQLTEGLANGGQGRATVLADRQIIIANNEKTLPDLCIQPLPGLHG